METQGNRKSIKRGPELYAVVLLSCLCLFLIGAAMYSAANFLLPKSNVSISEPKDFTDGWITREKNVVICMNTLSRENAKAQGKTLLATNRLPLTLTNSDILAIQTKNEVIDVLVDNQLVYSYGHGKLEAMSCETGAVWNMIELPKDSAGKTVTLVLKPIGPRTGEAPYRVYIGHNDTIYLMLVKESIRLATICMLLFVAAIIIFVASIIGFIRRSEFAYSLFCFSIFVLLCTIWALADGLFLQFIFENKAVSYFIFGATFYSLPIPFLLFTSTYLTKHKRVYQFEATAMTLYVIVRIILYLKGIASFEYGLFIIHIFMVVCLCTIQLGLIGEDKDKRNPYVQTGIVLFAIGEVIPLISFYAGRKLDVYRHGFASGFYYGVLLFIVVIIVGIIRESFKFRENAMKAEYFRQRANTDDFTGLLNTSGFDIEAESLLSRYPERFYVIIDFDINFFAQFSANFDTISGNDLILKLAQALTYDRHDDELVAHISLDHFCCMYYGENMEEIMERLSENNLRFRKVNDLDNLLISFGLVEAGAYKENVSTLRSYASVAKSSVKGNYVNTMAVFNDEMKKKIVSDALFFNHFESDLRDDRFLAYLQPKIDSSTGRMVGAEALARYMNNKGDIIMPGRFIPLLEDRGLISKLDFYIYECVLKFLAQRIKDGAPPFVISVNFSRVNLFNSDFPHMVASLAVDYGIPTSFLELELTESAFSANGDVLKSMIKRLKLAGFRLSIDDFGSGYSSLNMLKEYSVDVIKLDKGFMPKGRDHKAEVVLKNVIKLARDLGMDVVAEGVETMEHVRILKECGCNTIQGFYYSRPISLTDFAEKYPS